MKRRQGVKLVGILAVLVMLQWALYGCGGGSDNPHLGTPPSGTEPPGNTEPPPATFVEPVTGMEFVLVEGGCFEMGDNFGDGSSHERPVHDVCLYPYYMGKYPVTQGEWKTIMGNDPSLFRDCGDCPVENISWNEVQLFLQAFIANGETIYRLPTEAEWEYAARDGGKEKQKYAGIGEDVDVANIGEYAWYRENSGIITHPVGLKLPSTLGLFDMSGNVMEWVHDFYGPYPEAGSITWNPTGPEEGDFRIYRGSSCGDTLTLLRASVRDFNGPDFKAEGQLGFRLAFSAPIEE